MASPVKQLNAGTPFLHSHAKVSLINLQQIPLVLSTVIPPWPCPGNLCSSDWLP